ncbi:3-hydroxyacyl-CoA dehydrogenase family protein [Gordonia sp. (in: high G+C Gram-positive bacteria)]|uniref:3-hydroxyacyl-CoA dehydrogenase family protein n=1 Tax=Gordonia sp. (in: high G+C Gram-positive bacteria) TaxID=84139 RepID=UPI003F950DA8
MSETIALPQTCGVVGGGRMGAGIAHAMLLAGSGVTVLERDADAAVGASERVERAVHASVRRGVLDDAASVLARFSCTTSVDDLAPAGLVVEAVPEDVALKTDTLTRIEGVVAGDAVIATNTSSISLDVLGAALDDPKRLVGLHFFNPVPASKLIEVVYADATDDALTERAAGWVRAMGKTPVVVRNAPGFASSRLGVAIGLEAIRMVEDGVASAADIDAAMELGYGYPMGPLKLTDIVGIDVRLGISRYLEQEIGPRFAPPQLMVDMVERGDLGRKSGRGFYEWDD